MDVEASSTSPEVCLAGTYKAQHCIEPSPELRFCASYDIAPTMGFIHGGPVYSLAISWNTKYLFTGSEDGFVRKYNFYDTLNDKQPLTVGQRHALPDSTTKGGVIVSYWENEQPLYEDEYVETNGMYLPKVSPVYSLVADAEALWLCAGLESGGISVQSARYSEGQILAYLDGHQRCVSDLALAPDGVRLLSGSWDRSLRVWDLNTGQTAAQFANLNGQVSTVAWQQLGAPFYTAGAGSEDKSMGSLFGSDDEAAGSDAPSEPSGAARNDSGTTLLSTTITGTIETWDTRSPARCAAYTGSAAPPWCMSACWSHDGSSIYVGRRNSTLDVYDIRNPQAPADVLRLPSISGPVSAVAAMPNGRGVLAGSVDNIRLYDLQSTRKTPFYIVAGHHGAVVSRLLLDPSGQYLFSSSGGRGWLPGSTDIVLGYEIEPEAESGPV